MVVSGWYEKGRCVGRLGRTRRRGKEREREQLGLSVWPYVQGVSLGTVN